MRNKKRAQEHGASHDRWLVSYSDFITVLFALFVVLFATSYRDSQAIKRVSHAIHVGFQTMGAFSSESVETGPVDSNNSIDSPPDQATAQQEKRPTINTPPASPVNFDQLQKELELAIGQEIRKHEVVMHVSPEGFVISLRDLGFFNSGEAELLPGAAEKIQRIAKILAQHGLELRVEGHSDDQPIHTEQFRSNWELSTARAMTVLLLLVNDSGLDPRKVSIAGYGQYRPVADNATPEGRQMNRRVDLVVVAPTIQH
jgi:chemotaxis protein MotB